MSNKPCVLIFAGLDPSGGAGIQADITTICALGAHPLSIITTLTVQDNNRVYGIEPVAAALIEQQAQALLKTISIAAIKVGIIGNQANANAIANIITVLRQQQPNIPVVVDPILASGRGDPLAQEDATQIVSTLLPLTTVITPNTIEAGKLCPHANTHSDQAHELQQLGCQHVFLSGGHINSGASITNTWWNEKSESQQWSWPRLIGEFHGSGCTLASAMAAHLALGKSMQDALENAQQFCWQSLKEAYAIAEGQKVPGRVSIASRP